MVAVMALFDFTKKADYGLVMLAVLASKGKHKTVSVRELVDGKKLPRAFTAQIGKSLVEAGILGSKEGRCGGYFLIDDPSEVTLRQALTAIEGEIAPVGCVAGSMKTCPLDGNCGHQDLMSTLGTEMARVLEGYSLADLVK